MIVEMGEKKVDLAKAFPMTIGDFKTLEGVGVIDEKGDMNVGSPTKLVGLVLHMFRKADDSVTEAEVENISVEEMEKIGAYFNQKLKRPLRRADRPT